MSVWLFLGLAFVAANLPWLSERTFFIFFHSGVKPEFVRLMEWLVFYCGFVLLGLGFERMYNGEIYSQDWEFYAVTALLFVVFAIPGFIYHHDLKRHLRGAGKP